MLLVSVWLLAFETPWWTTDHAFEGSGFKSTVIRIAPSFYQSFSNHGNLNNCRERLITTQKLALKPVRTEVCLTTFLFQLNNHVFKNFTITERILARWLDESYGLREYRPWRWRNMPQCRLFRFWFFVKKNKCYCKKINRPQFSMVYLLTKLAHEMAGDQLVDFPVNLALRLAIISKSIFCTEKS